MEATQKPNQEGRDAFAEWQKRCQKNCFQEDQDYQHSLAFAFGDHYKNVVDALKQFGAQVPTQLEMAVAENNLAINLPYLRLYDAIGNRIDEVVHDLSYVKAGDIIYGSGLMKKLLGAGGLLECLSLLFLSAQTGEAGHNCPIACSAGIMRVLQNIPDFPEKKALLEKLTAPSFQENFTGAQFLTEIQGGSDVGLNATYAEKEKENIWRIYGEKWFCSNANADLIFMTARYDKNMAGTKGLALFLVPAKWQGKKNHYQIRRLKDKIGTRSMATGEIDFNGAYAWQIGTLEEGFQLVMHHVLHLSRLFNSFCVLGMARRAYTIAYHYAECRVAFGQPILHYPLVIEKLARIKTENTAMLAGIIATTKLQDEFDKQNSKDKKQQLLLRLLVNMQKYLTALWSVQHIHHALDTLAGNGTIESFSSIPRLLRDAIVCENWEGAHNVLLMQIYKDMEKYAIGEIYCNYVAEELTKLKSEPKAAVLNDFFEQLRKELAQFKNLDPAIQLLQIRLIVDKMAELYCATMLLFEANHQVKAQHQFSKQNLFDYFVLLHIKKEINYDKNYLALIHNIVMPTRE